MPTTATRPPRKRSTRTTSTVTHTNFTTRSRIAKAVGKQTRYASQHVQAIPTPAPGNLRRKVRRGDHGKSPTSKSDAPNSGVVLKATDGHQGVCVFAEGQAIGPHLIPGAVLPTKRTGPDVSVRLVEGRWESSDGKFADSLDRQDVAFPPLADVLPDVGQRPAAYATDQKVSATHIALGIDIELLHKQAEAFDTTKLTLMIPVPRVPTGHASGAGHNSGAGGGGGGISGGVGGGGEVVVNKPIAVCPANSETSVQGVGVVMPLQPERVIGYYNKLRQAVIRAEAALRKSEPVKKSKPPKGKRAS